MLVLGRGQCVYHAMCAKTRICEQVWPNCRTGSHFTGSEVKRVRGEAGEVGRVQITRGRLPEALRNGPFLNRHSEDIDYVRQVGCREQKCRHTFV